MPIGALLCGGGSAFQSGITKIDKTLRREIFVVTDRACDAERKMDELKISRVRVAAPSDRQERSMAIADALLKAECRFCFVLYDRLVTADLFDALTCINIHPSMLPAFPGMCAVQKAFEAGAARLGVTAHLIDAGIDTGPVLAQFDAPMPVGLDQANHLSYLQKASLVEALIPIVSRVASGTGADLVESCRRVTFDWRS